LNRAGEKEYQMRIEQQKRAIQYYDGYLEELKV
jgi:hypothetical protein